MEQTAATRSLTFLDETGDITIVWDEESEDQMIPLIQKRLDEGYQFFILQPRAIPILPPKKVRAKNVEEIKKAGCAILKDADMDQLFKEGTISTSTASTGSLDVVRKGKTAKEIKSSQAVAVKPARGG